MSISKSQIIWFDAKVMSPEKDGTYLANTCGDHYADLSYTTIGGWNTHKDLSGNVNTETAIEITAWAFLPEKEVFA